MAPSPSPSGGGEVAALPTVLFGLFTFVLMSVGVAGDATLVGEGEGRLPYYLREAFLLAGFALYGAWASWAGKRFAQRRLGAGMLGCLTAVFCCGMLAILLGARGLPLTAAVLIASLSVGVMGGAVYDCVAQSATPATGGATRTLGAIVGIGGALAVVTQYALQFLLPIGRWLPVVLAACFCLLAMLMHRASGKAAAERVPASTDAPIAVSGEEAHAPSPVLLLSAVVACLFALFPFYEVVIRDAYAGAYFYQWHRLFLAAGYLAIGAAAFFGGRPVASLAVAVAALFCAFVLAQAAALQVEDFTAALFYTLLGAVVAYAGIAFMALAPHTAQPALAASGGRLLEGALTIVGGGAATLVNGLPAAAVLLVALALIAVVIAAMAHGGFFVPRAAERSEKEPEQAVRTTQVKTTAQAAAKGPTQLIDAAIPIDAAAVADIADRYDLTRRETEVLCLVFQDLTAQQIADELVITKSTAKYHVTNILKKTGTQTRRQLIESATRK